MISAHRQGAFTPRYFRILSIDGGGMRGLIPLYALDSLEQKLKARTRDPSVCLADFFELVVGTSSGSIIASSLLYPDHGKKNPRSKYSPREIIDLYMEYGKEIFGASWWQSIKSVGGLTEAKFSDAGIKRVMKRYLGDAELKDLIKPCLLPVYNIMRQQNFFFRQHRAIKYPHENFLLRDVVRGCTAAPVIFPIAEVRSMANRLYHFVDGGIFAYNPAACAYIEARKLFPKIHAENMLLLSLSGGAFVDVELPDEKDRDWGAWEWMSAIHYIASASQIDVVHSQMEQMFLTCSDRHQYLRIHPSSGMGAMKLDETDAKSLKEMCGLAAQIAQRHNNRLNAFADLLLSEADTQAKAS